MWLLVQTICILSIFSLFSIVTIATETEVTRALISEGKSCPGCGGVDCTNNVFAFGIPILQLIGGVAAGLIWAGIFIWIYVWVEQGAGSGNGRGDYANKNDFFEAAPLPSNSQLYSEYQRAADAATAADGTKAQRYKDVAPGRSIDTLMKTVNRGINSKF